MAGVNVLNRRLAYIDFAHDERRKLLWFRVLMEHHVEALHFIPESGALRDRSEAREKKGCGRRRLQAISEGDSQ